MTENEAVRRVEVRSTAPRRFHGRCVRGFQTRTFGGSVLGQCLTAAATEAEPGRSTNALHAYFLSPGSPERPMEYEVKPIKLGRSLDIVNVVAEQGGRTVMTMQASFHRPEPSRDFQVRAPAVPGPHELIEETETPGGTNPEVRAPFERRNIEEACLPGSFSPDRRRQAVWVRTRQPVSEGGQTVHAALAAYAADFLITRVAHLPLGGVGVAPAGASLDHAMWFHRAFRADEWLLFSSEAVSYSGARTMSRSLIFNEAGDLVASAAQEALLRSTDPPEGRSLRARPSALDPLDSL